MTTRLPAGTLLALTLAGAAPATAQTTQFPLPYAPTSAFPAVRSTPGVTVRLAGRYRFYGAYVNQDNDSGPAGSLNEFDFFDYARLWPGFDGQAENGLQYGATLEIRLGSGAEARGDGRGELRYRRMFGYVGLPSLGQLRVGSGQTLAVELMRAGYANGFTASGLWNGDGRFPVVGANNLLSQMFWYASSSVNNPTGIGYYSPRFMGFDIGVSYAANNGNFGGDTACSAIGPNCDRLDASPAAAGTIKTLDIIDLMARWRGTVAGVALAVSGGWRGSDTVDAIGTANSYDGLSLGLLGAEGRIGGLTVGGIMTFGRANFTNGLASGATAINPLAETVAAAPGRTAVVDDDQMLTWEVGLNYRFGALAVGGAYGQATYEGSQQVAADRRDQLFGVGASYLVAPGFNVFAEYLWGRRRESGVALSAGGGNSLETNVFILGTAYNW